MTVEQKQRGASPSGTTSLLMRVRRNVKLTSAVDARTGTVQYFAKDAASGEVFYFGEQELFLCQALDGARSFEQVQSDFEAKFKTRLTEGQLSAFIQELSEAGLLEPANSSSGDGEAWKIEPVASPASAPPPDEPFRMRFRWPLFDPSGFFGVAAKLLFPLKYCVWMLLPAMLVAGLVIVHHTDELFSDVITWTASRGVQAWVIIGALILLFEFLVRSAEGITATAFGARIREFGFQLTAGFIPRLYVDTRPLWQMPRRTRLWSAGAPLLMRLTIFSVGVFVWFTYRSSGTALPQLALVMSQFAFWSFVITAFPLIPGDGYRWLAEYLDQPLLLDRAMRLLDMKAQGRRAPEALKPAEHWGLLLFAIGVILVTGFVAGGMLLYVGVRFESLYRGAGMVMFLTICAMTAAWCFSVWAGVKRLRAESKGDIGQLANVVTMRNLPATKAPLPAEVAPRPARHVHEPLQFSAARPPQPTRWRRYMIWGGALGTLAIVGILPYPYEAGGDFNILPTARVEVRARVDGEVLNIFVREGDWVEKGQILAVVSDWDEVKDLAVTKASLEKSQADLQHLRDGAKPEEIDLAQKQVDAAQARITFTKAEAERQSQLLRSGTASKRDAEAAVSAYNQNVADLAVAVANLTLVKSGTTATALAAAEAEVRRLEEQYAYLQDQVERTRLRAPASGRVVTPDLNLKLGSYLEVGGLFTELEDTRVAQAEILVPESDIDQVQLGDRVRLKPWGYSEDEITGKVIEIAPIAEKIDYGLVVRVKTEVPNESGLLKSATTGYGKIEGSEMPVWEAFTRPIVRFFRVEVWSWIP